MKSIIVGIISVVITSIVIGSIFFTGMIVFSNQEQNLELTNYKCVQMFDNLIVPIMVGKTISLEKSSHAWKEFGSEKCATNHTQWEELSLNQDYIQTLGWNSLIQMEQITSSQDEENQKLEIIKSEIVDKNILSGYKVNTECEFFELLRNEPLGKKMYEDSRYIEPLKETLMKYKDHFIRGNSFSDISQVPPELIDVMASAIVDSNQINPELQPFVKKIMRGEITQGEILQIIVNEQSECGESARNDMINSFEHDLLNTQKNQEHVSSKPNAEDTETLEKSSDHCGAGTVFDEKVNSCILDK